MAAAVERWAEAERLLSGDPSTRVRCPSCAGDFLVVAEVEGEVHMTCPRCLDRHVAPRAR